MIQGCISAYHEICSGGQKNRAQYKLVNRISLEGDGGWYYLTMDVPTSRLFASHGTVVHVVDVLSGKVIRTIPDTKGVHGIATSVTVFDPGNRTPEVIEGQMKLKEKLKGD